MFRLQPPPASAPVGRSGCNIDLRLRLCGRLLSASLLAAPISNSDFARVGDNHIGLAALDYQLIRSG
jgi:hypothetical protein